MLKGIDVSYWKRDLNLGAISYDFMIAKATGGTGYVDSSCDPFVQKAIAMGKKWGVYHYRGDGFGYAPPVVEADYFVDNCLGYVGKGLLILDWEAGGNPNVGDVNWAKLWLRHVYTRTGVKPLIYLNLDLLKSFNWSPVIAEGYGLWLATYVDNYSVVPNYQMDVNRDPNPHWDGVVNNVLWQFTSTGRLNGYGGNLDCNFFYGNQATWDAYAVAAPVTPPGSNGGTSETTTTTTQATVTTTTTMAPTTTTTQSPAPTATTTTTLEPGTPTTTPPGSGTPTSPQMPPVEAPATLVDLLKFIIQLIVNHFRRAK